MEPPFQRTTCACVECVGCCKRQPGYLIPSDIEKIRAAINRPLEEVLVDSPGSLVMNTDKGIITRIRTIVPKMQKGRCVFLDKNDRCSIHAVAPAGCRLFDTHMSLQEGQKRGLWTIRQVKGNPEYASLREKLPLAKTYQPTSFDNIAGLMKF